ncbi:uncharacterized protein UMAG_02520 [Mycosarcoma maydis]|uniref:Spindle pole body component n=1 Tax=Mycosarcoma maydis TaxID=5270 RepID=A0A0D1DYM6_MYCMD|nr:uncharacterized protein UMAG_02520 [Ustilago maydis 521]KIS69169.1 hypothetical protein UMAG_02520 [Ustilago maydis 521]|eukprot:XP_011388935.1 hypothetical protein UMAG_02520 [Ustilago maydis 521]
MIAELLAMLVGHPSSLFASSSTASSASGSSSTALKVRDDLNFLHPSEIEILNHLATFYTRYNRVKSFAEDQIEAARQRAVRAALRANSLASRSASSAKEAQAQLEQQPTLHLVPLCSTLLSILAEYHELVLQTERLVLENHVELVASTGFVSLANLRARFEPWNAPLTALDDIVTLLARGPSKGRDIAFAKESDAQHATQDGHDGGASPYFPASWTGGLLIDLLSLKANTGVERVASHMARLRNAVEDSWMQHLTAWVCRGEIHRPGGIADSQASKRNLISRDQLVHWIEATDADAHTDHLATAAASGDGLGDWAASSSNTWNFRPDALPSSISDSTADSILYVGRALYTIRNASTSSAHHLDTPTHHALPSGPPDKVIQLHESALARPQVRPSRPADLDRAIQSLRNDVSEWIFRHILTTSVVRTSLQCLGDYFLHRNGSYTLSLLGEVEAMKKNKLYRARSAAASMIRSSDLELSLRRATVGTWAEDDPSLQRLRFVLPKGGYRPSLVGARTAKVRGLAAATTTTTSADTTVGGTTSLQTTRFDDFLIGVPAQLHYTAVFPLDLFLSASDLAAYSRIFSYLIAIKKVHARVLDCWITLSKNQRSRRKFTGTGEGGVDAQEEKQRTKLLRCSWGLVRNMKWFLDTLLGHFQTDIIDAQFSNLVERLGASGGSIESARGGAAGGGLRTRKDSELQQHRASSPVGSIVAHSEAYGDEARPRVTSGTFSRASTVVGGGSGNGRANRRLAFPVSGPASSTYAPPPASVTGRGARRFVSTSTRPESILDGADTIRHDGTEAHLTDEQDAPDAMLDFGSLRTSHTAFLAFVQDGLLLSSPVASSIVRSVLDICDRLAGTVERWAGDVLPPLLTTSATTTDTSSAIEQRQSLIDKFTTEIDHELSRFFRLLSSSTSSSPSYQSASNTSNTTASAMAAADESGLGSLSISVAQLHMSRGEAAKIDVLSGASSARKHLEQLLLRLDYSGFFAEQLQRQRAGLDAKLDNALVR